MNRRNRVVPRAEIRIGIVLGSELTQQLRRALDVREQSGRPATVATIVEAARRLEEVAIGYRIRSESSDAARVYGVHLNPRTSATVTFELADKVIVLGKN